MKWIVRPIDKDSIGVESELQADKYLVVDNAVGLFFNEMGDLIHSVPANRVIVRETTNSYQRD